MSIPVDELEAMAARLGELRHDAPTKHVATALQAAQRSVESALYWNRQGPAPTGRKPGSSAITVARPPRRVEASPGPVA